MKRRRYAVLAGVLAGLGLAALADAQRSESPEESPARAAVAHAAVTTGASGTSAESLVEVKRIYVAQLTGGIQADALRDLIIASLDSTKLFVLTDNPEHADAVLKGAADDKAFTDTFDSEESLNSHSNGGTGSQSYSRSSRGVYGGLGVGENESHHIKERKHEAYATVRLVGRDGDVLWSTTQESLGAKFRGASADVAAKIAKQLTLDFDRAQRANAPGKLSSALSSPNPGPPTR